MLLLYSYFCKMNYTQRLKSYSCETNIWNARQFKSQYLSSKIFCEISIVNMKELVMAIRQGINVGHKMISRFNIVPTNTYTHTKAM
jgi:hypothetical protein